MVNPRSCTIATDISSIKRLRVRTFEKKKKKITLFTFPAHEKVTVTAVMDYYRMHYCGVRIY